MDPGELSFSYLRNQGLENDEDFLQKRTLEHYEVGDIQGMQYEQQNHSLGTNQLYYFPENTRKKSITQQLFQEPNVNSAIYPSFDSYELYKQAYDMDPNMNFSNLNKISIKTENNAFKANDAGVQIQQPHVLTSAAPEYFPHTDQGHFYPFPANSNNRDYLNERMNKLSFQQQASFYPTDELGLPRNFSQSTVKLPKSRKLNSKDSPGGQRQLLVSNASAKPIGSKIGTGRRKWTSYEDDQLRKAVQTNGAKNWKSIALMVPGRNHVQCLQRWKKVLKPGLIKGHWSKEEDEQLREIVKKGYRNWGEVAQKIKGRTAKQCRERWCCNLDPKIRRDKWTEEEDAKILAAQKEIGNKWSTIAQMLPGRTENSIKTRAKSLQRQAKKKWSKVEDDIIISLKTISGKNLDSNSVLEDEDIEASLGLRRSSAWAKIAEKLPGRSKNAVKKRWKELRNIIINSDKANQQIRLQ